MDPAFSVPECLPLAGVPKDLHRTLAFPLGLRITVVFAWGLFLPLARWLSHARPKSTRASTISYRLSISATHTTRGHIRELRSFALGFLGVSSKSALVEEQSSTDSPKGGCFGRESSTRERLASCPHRKRPRVRCHLAALPVSGSTHRCSQLGQGLVSCALRDKGRRLSRPDTFHRQGLKRATVGLKPPCRPPQLWP